MGRKSAFSIGKISGFKMPKNNWAKTASIDLDLGFKMPKSRRGGWGRKKYNPTRIIWEK